MISNVVLLCFSLVFLLLGLSFSHRVSFSRPSPPFRAWKIICKRMELRYGEEGGGRQEDSNPPISRTLTQHKGRRCSLIFQILLFFSWEAAGGNVFLIEGKLLKVCLRIWGKLRNKTEATTANETDYQKKKPFFSLLLFTLQLSAPMVSCGCNACMSECEIRNDAFPANTSLVKMI